MEVTFILHFGGNCVQPVAEGPKILLSSKL